MEIKPRDYYLIQQLANAIGESEMETAKFLINLDVEQIKKNIAEGVYKTHKASAAYY